MWVYAQLIIMFSQNRIDYGLNLSAFLSEFQPAVDHDVQPLTLNDEQKKENCLSSW